MISKVVLFINKKSGQGKVEEIIDQAPILSKKYKIDLKIISVSDSNSFNQKLAELVLAAKDEYTRAIVAGGDGTIRSAAQLFYENSLPLAIIPCGTFNYFARFHKLSEKPLEAFEQIIQGQEKKVQLGKVNDFVFLINASLGLYEKAIRDRERLTSKFGRHRFVVIISTIISLVSDYFLLNLEFMKDNKTFKIKTPMLFIGNNALQLRNLNFSVAHCMQENLLAVVLMKPIKKLEVLWIILRGLNRTVENSERLNTFCLNELTIISPKMQYRMALDGELFKIEYPIKITSVPSALRLIVPRNSEVPDE